MADRSSSEDKDYALGQLVAHLAAAMAFEPRLKIPSAITVAEKSARLELVCVLAAMADMAIQCEQQDVTRSGTVFGGFCDRLGAMSSAGDPEMAERFLAMANARNAEYGACLKAGGQYRKGLLLVAERFCEYVGTREPHVAEWVAKLADMFLAKARALVSAG